MTAKAKVIGHIELPVSIPEEPIKAKVIGTMPRSFQKAQGEVFKQKEYYRELRKGRLTQQPFKGLLGGI